MAIPAELRAWTQRVRAEASAGQALSAYIWCVSGKGPFNWWLHTIGKTDTDQCGCEVVIIGTHVVEECLDLEEHRSQIDGERPTAAGGQRRAITGIENFLEIFFFHVFKFFAT